MNENFMIIKNKILYFDFFFFFYMYYGSFLLSFYFIHIPTFDS